MVQKCVKPYIERFIQFVSHQTELPNLTVVQIDITDHIASACIHLQQPQLWMPNTFMSFEQRSYLHKISWQRFRERFAKSLVFQCMSHVYKKVANVMCSLIWIYTYSIIGILVRYVFQNSITELNAMKPEWMQIIISLI